MKKNNSVKKTVTIGIGAAIYVILSCCATIPIGPNVVIETSTPFLSFISVVFGSSIGFYVGIIGHTIKDFIIFGNVYWNWILCSGIIGFICGLSCKIIDLKCQNFNKNKIVGFWLYQAFANLLVWGIIAPISDIWIYSQPEKLVYLQSFLIVVSNIVANSTIGLKLMIAYSNRHIKKETLIKSNYL